MGFFDFSEDVERTAVDATDLVSRLSARTDVGRKMFPGAARRAGFSLLDDGGPFSPSSHKHALVIGVATWSDPDLEALERLARNVRGRDVSVTVFDIDDWASKDIPRVLTDAFIFRQSPMVLQYRDGALTFSGEGRDAIMWLDEI
jgi:hypothetical protein